MHYASSPLLRGPKSETCSSPSEGSGGLGSANASGFSVIFRPVESPVNIPSSGHDSISLQRYSTHSAARLISVGHAGSDEG